mmetsp:Transcript_571/g.1313  ORF Transcript_571/g.1313 Transcript_571/m.1313 type:complete len:262 (-) Transcript_571:239-1024(-)
MREGDIGDRNAEEVANWRPPVLVVGNHQQPFRRNHLLDARVVGVVEVDHSLLVLGAVLHGGVDRTVRPEDDPSHQERLQLSEASNDGEEKPHDAECPGIEGEFANRVRHRVVPQLGARPLRVDDLGLGVHVEDEGVVAGKVDRVDRGVVSPPLEDFPQRPRFAAGFEGVQPKLHLRGASLAPRNDFLRVVRLVAQDLERLLEGGASRPARPGPDDLNGRVGPPNTIVHKKKKRQQKEHRFACLGAHAPSFLHFLLRGDDAK